VFKSTSKLILFFVSLLTVLQFSACKKNGTDGEREIEYPAYFDFTQTNLLTTANNMYRMDNSNFAVMINEQALDKSLSLVSFIKLEVNGQSGGPIKRQKQIILSTKLFTGNNFVFVEKQNRFFYANSSYDTSSILSLLDLGSLDLAFNATAQNHETSAIKTEVHKVIPLADGFVVVGGSTIGTNRNVFIKKYNTNLNSVWEKKYGGAADDFGIDAVQLCDGNIGILAHTYSYGAGDRDVWFLKVNQQGDSLTSHFFGGAGYEEPQQIIADERCRYYIAAHSSSFGHPEHNGYIVCVDDNGNKIWENNYGTPNHDGFNAIALLPNKKGVIAAGRSMIAFSGQEDIFVQAVNFEGTPLWSKIYGHATKSENSIAITTDNEFYYLLLNRTLATQNEAIFVVDKLE
jgi:hypothetical protein